MRYTLSVLTALLFAFGSLNFSVNAQTRVAICPNPSAPCGQFEQYKLPLRLPRRIRPNTTYRSVTFYAVVLRSLPYDETGNCDLHEPERARVQERFPERKVFYDTQCPDLEGIAYMDAGNNQPIREVLAIYAGSTPAEAQQVLARVRAMGGYRNARVRRMYGVFESIQC